MTKQLFIFLAFLFFLSTNIVSVNIIFAEEPVIQENSFQSDCPIIRAERPFHFTAIIENIPKTEYRCRLIVPNDGTRFKETEMTKSVDGFPKHVWEVVCAVSGQKEFTLELFTGDKMIQKTTVSQIVLPPRNIEKLDSIPAPKPVATKILVGAHNCPLWEREYANLWNQVVHKHQERTPALGIYSQDNPEIADWETKWALEHGVSFFIYCWYRTSQGKNVETKFEKSVFDNALFKSKYGNMMKFTIMWENQSKGRSGIADEKDLMENLLPYWIEKFFKRENYLKIDNKPVLFIYRPEVVSFDLGGDDKAKNAFDMMREGCKKAGFDGLYLLGEYRGTDPNVLKRYKNFGLDYTFAYCWHVQNSPPPNVVIETQLNYIRKTQEMHDIIPQVVTLSQAWSGWKDEGSIWKLPPDDFETLLRKGKEFIETNIPKNELGSKMMILDNWNEWSEGHYIAPYREYGFGYLDAVRRVFSDAPEQHEDLIPSDIGFGTYDLPQTIFENRTSWNFIDDNPASRIENSYQGWSPMMNIKDFRIENNRLRFETTTNDPAIRVLQKRTPALNFRNVIIRMKTNSSQNERLQFFWKTETAQDFSEDAKVEATVHPSENFADYSLDLFRNANWNGRITELRFDPVMSSGITVELESIRLE
ncbi:MAG: glycoside hydrolase family 99-like domain-containing protein [Planctomycetaceae bacterium]|nr:glycoside hydrolase family 99-like domain-containing protein [Planctomycetaceae bacterium]